MSTTMVPLTEDQKIEFKNALKAKMIEKAAAKKVDAKAAAVPAVKPTPKAKAAPAKRTPVVALPAMSKSLPEPTVATKYVANAPEHYYVARDVRGRILPLVIDGKAHFAVPSVALKDGGPSKDLLVARVQYGPVYKVAGIFVTVHRNTSAEGERRLQTLRNLWSSKRSDEWTQPVKGEWSQVLVKSKADKATKVYADMPSLA